MTQLEQDAAIDGFQVIRLLGRGGMGEVYLALDTKLGRKVALKLVNPEQIGSGDAVERFLFEARATAAFNHPNIITVYAAGEYQGRPYVALEYLEGQDLRQRMLEGELGLREVMRIGRAIASALAEAHRHHLMHRDLKPDNVLIADDGLVRVVDFGLAKAIDAKRWAGERPLSTSVGQWIGTPAYMAPEQWLCKPTTEATDVWALGVVLYEMVAGKRPYAGVAPEELVERVTERAPVPPLGHVGEIPGPLAELINGCLTKDPGARPSAADVARELGALLHEGLARLGDERCPFPGLLPFSEDQAVFFYGRDAEVLAFVERLRRDAVLPVVGLSGAGKSSFVQAGVIPHLREQGRWVVLQLRPGQRPFQTISERVIDALRVARRGIDTVSTVDAKRGARPHKQGAAEPPAAIPDDPELLAGRLQDSPPLLALCLRRLAELAQSRVLLFVDQLEELHALVEDPVQRARFTRAVCGAAGDAHEPVRVIFTLRDDFLVRLADSAEVRHALRHLTVLRTPGREALREALSEPLKAIDYDYDDANLVGEMVGSVEGEAASLPLLQFSARVLWEHRDRQRRRLRRAAYEEMGGVVGALASHADGVLAGLSDEQRGVARLLLLRLVTAEGQRRTLARRALLDGADRASLDVLDRLTDSRLVTVRQGAAEDGAAAHELAHEALITHWGTLARWLEDSRHERAQLAELEQSAELWHRRGRRPEETWSGVALREARRVAERHQSSLPRRAAEFLEVGERREGRRMRGRRLAVGSLVTLLLAIAAGSLVVAWALSNQEQRARRQRRVAERQRAVALREAARAALRHGQVLEARAKLRLSVEGEDSIAARALWLQLDDEPLQWLRRLPASALDVAFSRDGTHIAVAGQDRVVYLFDARTRAVERLAEHPDQVLAVAFSPDGQQLAAGTRAGEIWLWRLSDRTRRVLDGHDGPMRRVVFRPDGKQLASASWDATVRLWPLDGGGDSRVLRGHRDRVYGLAYSPDGSLVASGSYDRTVCLWPVAGGKPRLLRGHGDRVFSVAFSADGKQLASGSWDRTIRLWDVQSGAMRRQLQGHADGVTAVSFVGPRQLVSSGGDKTVRLWDLRTGEVQRTIEAHEAGITSIAPDASGRYLASSSYDKTVRLWDLQRATDHVPHRGHADRVNGVAFSPDSRLVASASSDQTVRLWDVHRGRELRLLRGHENGVIRVRFNPTGDTLASSGWDNAIRLWNPAVGRVERVLLGHTGEIHDLQFESNGRHLLSASFDRTIRIWNTSSGAIDGVVQAHEAGVRAIRLSPDGRLLASAGGDRKIQLHDVESGRLVRELQGHEGTVTSLDFAADGRLVSGSYDQTVRLWEVNEGVSRVVGRHPGRVHAVAFHPSGELVGSAGADGAVRLWGLASGKVTRLEGHRASVNDLSFSGDGQLVATCGDDGSVRLWQVDGAPLWRSTLVETLPPMNMTHRGWVWPKRDVPGLPLEQAKLITPTGDERSQAFCVMTTDGRLELWRGGNRLLDEPVEGLRRVIGLGNGCAALGQAGLLRYADAGLVETIDGARAVARAGDGLVLATDHAVLVLGPGGERRAHYPNEPGVTALGDLGGDEIVAGYADGHVARVGRQARQAMTFADAPASAVTRFHAGPKRTLIVGFADGEVGLWDRLGGPQLEHASLHGPITHLSVHQSKLYVASELGDSWIWQLEPFYVEYCAFLRQVWRSVPVSWKRGMAEIQPPPPRHPCHTDGS